MVVAQFQKRDYSLDRASTKAEKQWGALTKALTKADEAVVTMNLWRSYRGTEPTGVAPPRIHEHQLSYVTVAQQEETRAVGDLAPSLFPIVFAFWQEKVLIVVDFLQLVGLLWITAQPWPWPPYPFVLQSQWIVYANLDFFSVAKTGALLGATGNIGLPRWGKMDGYWYYALSYLFAQSALVIFFLLLRWLIFPVWAKRWNRFKPPALVFLLFMLYISYLPVGIAVFRLYFCETSTGETTSLSGLPAGIKFLSADPSMQCWTGSHLACVILSVLFHGPVFVGLPVVIRHFVCDAIVYEDEHDHEKRLQAWEIGFLLDVDRHWLSGNLWLCGSFRLAAAHLHVHLTVLKALLLLFFIFLRDDFKSQAAAMWWSVVIFSFYYGFYQLHCYRVTSSNIMHKIAVWLMLANFSLAAIDSSGLRNAVTVASNQALLLLLINISGLACTVAIFVSVAINPLSTHPAVRTLFRVTHSKVLHPMAAQWVTNMRMAIQQLDQLAVVPAEVTDPRILDCLVIAIRRDWLHARSYGSIFQLLLQDFCEDTIIRRSRRANLLYREHSTAWDESYKEAAAKMLYSRRRSQLALMTPLKRRILTKLLALRLFQTKFHYASSGIDDFDHEVEMLVENPQALDALETYEHVRTKLA